MRNNLDSFESVLAFVIYIALQDKVFSDEERNALLLDVPLIKRFYFDCYGEFIKSDAIEQVNDLEKKLLKLKFLFGRDISEKEEIFIKSLIDGSQVRNLALLISRHVAKSDGFHFKEESKYNHWSRTFSQL
jgi:hypothetical protein